MKLFISLCLTILACCTTASAREKTLVDFFLPMEPQGDLVSEGIWGADNVLPRDIRNGLEDPDLSDWCYWDGSIVKDDKGTYHMYACRWTQSVHHSVGWNKNSKGMHAVSDHLLGPYKDLGMTWPDWKAGEGANVIGLRMHDGRYALVTSEVTPGSVFASDSPYGPWEYLGELEIDNNGFYGGLARYDELDGGAVRAGTVGHMANVMIITRPEGHYMIVARHCAPMVSESGILGPYRILADKAWRGVKDMPQFKNEDPTVWHSDGLYHIVVNHHGLDITYHLTSEDGIHNWKNRGLAFHKEMGVFRYPDGTRNDWHIVQRPTVYLESDIVKAFNFSVIDVHKGQDDGNDNHGSKIIVVPFDGEGFNKHMTGIVHGELATARATPPPSPWKSTDLAGGEGNTGYETEFNTIRVETEGTRFVYQKMSGDVSVTVLVLSQDIPKDPAKAGLMFRDSLDPDAHFAWSSISRPGGYVLAATSEKEIASRDIAPPYWLRMEKRGDKIISYVSPSNRMNWKKTGETTIELGNEFYIGMTAASLNSGKTGLARFKDMDFHVWGDPTNEGIVNHTFPDILPANGKIKFEVEVECRQTSDVFVELEHVLTREKVPPLQKRLKKKGVMELTYDAGPLKTGEMYWVVIKTLPMHGHESMAYQSTFKKVVVTAD